MAQSSGECPGARKLPLGLRILAETGDCVILVAAQVAPYPQYRAGEILESLAPFPGCLIVDARAQRQRARPAAAIRPSQTQSPEFAIQIDYAPGTGNRNLRAERHGKKLLDLSGSCIPDQLDSVRGGKSMFIYQSALRIADTLASVEVDDACISLAWIRQHLSTRSVREGPGIVLVQFVNHQRKLGIVIEPVSQLGVRLVAGGSAMFAVAIRLKTRNIDHVI